MGKPRGPALANPTFLIVVILAAVVSLAFWSILAAAWLRASRPAMLCGRPASRVADELPLCEEHYAQRQHEACAAGEVVAVSEVRPGDACSWVRR